MLSFAQLEFSGKKKVTSRERFLAEIERLVPWARLLETLTPHYFPEATSKTRSRPPIGLERMLRMYCLQVWFSLAGEALEDALYPPPCAICSEPYHA